jgi:hypothetical protein
MTNAFLEPYYDPNDSGKTPAQQAGDALSGNNGVISAQDSALLRGVKMTGGRRVKSRRNLRRKQ